MGMARKLEDIHQDLTQLAGQGTAVGFLANAENAQQINSLVEDVREVMINYQVCFIGLFISTLSDICARLHCNKISMRRAPNLL
jgi:hypothetical protein